MPKARPARVPLLKPKAKKSKSLRSTGSRGRKNRVVSNSAASLVEQLKAASGTGGLRSTNVTRSPGGTPVRKTNRRRRKSQAKGQDFIHAALFEKFNTLKRMDSTNSSRSRASSVGSRRSMNTAATEDGDVDEHFGGWE